jgi:hypothetical protein
VLPSSKKMFAFCNLIVSSLPSTCFSHWEAHIHTYIHTLTHTNIYVCMYILEIIHLYEVSSPSSNKIGRQYGLTSLTLFMLLKNKEKIRYIPNLSKLTVFLFFVSTYWWSLFWDLSLMCHRMWGVQMV